jgi:hypothetical protein
MPPLWFDSESFTSTRRATSTGFARSGLSVLRAYSATTFRRGEPGVKKTKKRPFVA